MAPTTGGAANAAGGRTSGVINLDTEAQLVTSSRVATDAAKLLNTTTPAATLAQQVTVAVPANTTVLAITCESLSPHDAQTCAHAFAGAYLADRLATAQADIAAQTRALATTIKSQTSDLARINSELAATTVTAGTVITDAPLPTQPSAPSIPLFLASGGLLGLFAGLAGATVRQRLDKRVRFAGDVARHSGLPLLAQLPARIEPRSDDLYPTHGPAARAFHRLRNEVLASLGEEDRVIMVTGASPGNASTLVAANLAAALARSGSEVVLVSARLPESMGGVAPGTRVLGVAPAPGLSDVLAGRVALGSATQRAPRSPWLSVIATGGTASASGFLRSPALREILAQLRNRAEYVVIEAPPTADTADAQSLASLADVSIVVAELRRTTRSELVDAAVQLRRVTEAVLGCVVLPRLRRQRDRGEPEPTRTAGATFVTARGSGDRTEVIPVRARQPGMAAVPVRWEYPAPLTGQRRTPPGGRADRRGPAARRPSPRPVAGGPRDISGSGPQPLGDQTVTPHRIVDEPGGCPDAGCGAVR